MDNVKVTMELTMENAEELRDSLADIICWCRGYSAACKTSDGPIMTSIDTLSLVNIKLKAAIDKART